MDHSESAVHDHRLGFLNISGSTDLECYPGEDADRIVIGCVPAGAVIVELGTIEARIRNILNAHSCCETSAERRVRPAEWGAIELEEQTRAVWSVDPIA